MKKRIKYLGILLLLITSAVAGQNKPAGEAEAKGAFEYDIARNQIKVYVLGGIVAAVTKEDLDVANRFNFSYHDFGCTPPMNFEYYTFYNKAVFDYLIGQHGQGVIETLNKQSFGYRDYLKPPKIPLPQD